MKSQAALILLVLTISLVQAQTVNWVSVWNVEPTEKGCGPKETVTIRRRDDVLFFNWIWDNTEACREKELANTEFQQKVTKPSGNSATLTTIKAEFKIDGDKATLTIGEDTTTLKRKVVKPTVTWSGIWERQKSAILDLVNCSPDTEIKITSTETSIKYSWVWGKTDPCTLLLLAGRSVEGEIAIPSDNVANFYFLAIDKDNQGKFTVSDKKGDFKSDAGSSTYERKDLPPEKEGFKIGAVHIVIGVAVIAIIGFVVCQRKSKANELSRALNHQQNSWNRT